METPAWPQLPSGDDAPRSFADQEVGQRRLTLLRLPNLAPLTDLVLEMQATIGKAKFVPYFDPLSGGIHSRLLFLAESPGAATRDSVFISSNNNDQTASNAWKAQQAAELSR